MGDENPSFSRSPGENLDVLDSLESGRMSCLKIYRWLQASDREKDGSIEVSVSLIADLHDDRSCRRAAASFW